MKKDIKDVKGIDKQERINALLGKLYPHIKDDTRRLILLNVMSVMKLEGLVGVKVTKKDEKMIKMITDSILQDDQKQKSLIKRIKSASKKNGGQV